MGDAGLTEEIIKQYFTENSFERGREYYDDEAALSVTRRGNQLFSEVQGSDWEPYAARIDLEGEKFVQADCSCPYDWGGYCKHVAAVLLIWIHNRESVIERPTIAETLNALSREQLQGLVVELSERNPSLANLIESLSFDLQTTEQPGR